MSNPASNAIRVGAVVVTATAVLAWLILKVTSTQGFLPDRVLYNASFTRIQGLAEGAEVRYEGVTVGKVESIDFDENPNVNRINVRLSVRRSMSARIDSKVVAELHSNGPLGDRLIELRRPPLPAGEPLPEGATLDAKDPFEFGSLVAGGEDIFDDLQSISQSLKVITNRLVEGDGVFGRLLEDREFGESILTKLEVSMGHLEGFLADSSNGKNLLGSLVANEQLASDVVTSLRESTSNIEAISQRLEAGEGLVGQATMDDSELSRSVDDLRVAAANLRKFSEALDDSRGLVHRLVMDAEYGEATARDLREFVAHARSIAEKVDAGGGSLGLLVNDPAVYEGMSDITSGIEASWFVKQILKRKQKKGFEKRVDAILAKSPNPDAELLLLMEELLGQPDSDPAGQPEEDE